MMHERVGQKKFGQKKLCLSWLVLAFDRPHVMRPFSKVPIYRCGISPLWKLREIDATSWFRPLRKNMGKKNCELSAEDIQRICDTFLAFEETPQSKIFPNAAFGYWKVKVERPLRLHSQLSRQRLEPLRYASGDEDIRSAIYAELGDAIFQQWPATLQLRSLAEISADILALEKETDGLLQEITKGSLA